ncbi:unnamed protein product [Effrenium voratum]|nr:unnamed protein product [Effrenium voratum]
MFSVCDSTYAFVRRECADQIQFLPDKARTELVLAAFLMPLLGADLGREFLPAIIACDASPAFGFGVSCMKCSKGIAEQVGSLSEKRGDFVRFFSPSQASDRDRIGEPHTLPFRPSRFRDAISAKKLILAFSKLTVFCWQ